MGIFIRAIDRQTANAQADTLSLLWSSRVIGTYDDLKSITARLTEKSRKKSRAAVQEDEDDGDEWERLSRDMKGWG